MTALRDLLAEVAADAGPYDVTDRAVRTVRRRRRLAVLAPVAAALLVAAGTVASLPLRPDRGDEALVWSNEVSWLPTRLAPAQGAPPLPTDTGVAPAALAYGVPNGHAPGTLLTEDGRQYRVPGDEVLGISPDGRWMVYRRGGTLALRDLTGTAVRDLGVDGEVTIGAWSHDSRWLALRRFVEGDKARHTIVVDVETGESLAAVPDPDMETHLCGLRDSGELLTCRGEERSTRFVARWVDPRNGHESGRVTVDPSAAMTENERRGDWASPSSGPGTNGMLLRDGRTLLMRTIDYLPDRGLTQSGDVLAIDLDRPAATPRRYELPTPTLGKEQRNDDGSSSFGGSDAHVAVAVVDEGTLVIHYAPPRDAPIDPEVVVGLELLAADSGRLSRVTRVVGQVHTVLVRGQAQMD